MKENEPVDFKDKKKEIARKKKEEERAKKKAEKSRKFRESIKSDFDQSKFLEFIFRDLDEKDEKAKKRFLKRNKKEVDEFTLYKEAKMVGIAEPTASYCDIDFGETSLQKIERKFNRQKAIIIALLVAVGFAILFVWSANQSWAEERQVLKQTIATHKKAEEFKEQLKKFNYEKQDELIKFLDNKNIKYTVEERSDFKFIEFINDKIKYMIRIDNKNKSILVLT